MPQRVRAPMPRTADLSTGDLVRTAAALGTAWFGELVRREPTRCDRAASGERPGR